MNDIQQLLDLNRRNSATLLDLIDKEKEERNVAIEAFQEALTAHQGSLSVIDTLTRRIKAMLKARSHSRRRTIAIAVAALILGVLALWDSASIGPGFHQNLSIALGGALLTFVLVELFLHRMLEITSAEAKKAEDDLNKTAPKVEEMQKTGNEFQKVCQDFLKRVEEMDAKTDPLTDQVRKTLGDDPTTGHGA